eukprot:gene19291-26365_t
MAGSGAQEENLHRRTTLLEHLDHEGRRFHPINSGTCLYSPEVYVVRGTEKDGYPFLSEPFKIDVVSAAATSGPETKWVGGEQRLRDHEARRLSSTIDAVLRACAEHGAEEVVLCALGCGAFGNPPRHVAELFSVALARLRGGAPRSNPPHPPHPHPQVVFAIFDDHNARRRHNPHGNVAPFRDAFPPSFASPRAGGAPPGAAAGAAAAAFSARSVAEVRFRRAGLVDVRADEIHPVGGAAVDAAPGPDRRPGRGSLRPDCRFRRLPRQSLPFATSAAP